MCSIINFDKDIIILNLNYIFNKIKKIKKDKILIKINITIDDTDNLEKKYDFSEITIINLPFEFEDILTKIMNNIDSINTSIIILCKSNKEQQLNRKIEDFFKINNYINYKIMILHLVFNSNKSINYSITDSITDYIKNFSNIIVKNLIIIDEKIKDTTIPTEKIDTVAKKEYIKKTYLYLDGAYYIRSIHKQLLYMFFVNYFKLCGFSKLIQISGTCWINSVINTFFMATSIQKILYEKWKLMEIDDPQYINEIKESSFDTCPLNIKNMIYIIIY